MDIKNLLMSVYKDVSSGKKKNADVEFTTTSSKNFLLFIQRVKLKGTEAVLFNDLSNKMVEAIKKAGV
jgi:predicted Fe-Mo cluster-binding NifX family protein